MTQDPLTPSTILVDPLVWLQSRPKKKQTEPMHLWAYLIDEKSRLPLRWTTKPAGRMYTHAPNVQGVFPDYRAAVRVPGKLIAESDWSACDPRILARDSNDEQLVADLLSGDAYGWATELMAAGEVPARKRAKRAINAVLKGGGKPAVTKQGAPEDFVAKVKGRWPTAMAFLDRVVTVFAANDYAVNFPGRQVVLPEGSRERGSCIAAYFQAHESHALRKVLGSSLLRDVAEPILPIHDGIVWAVDPERVERARLLIPKAMAFVMLGNIDHPLAEDAATIALGPSWGQQDGSMVPSRAPLKRRSEWVRQGFDLLAALVADPSKVSEVNGNGENQLAVQFAALDEPGEYEVRVAAVAAAKGGRAAAGLLRKIGKHMHTEVRAYLDQRGADQGEVEAEWAMAHRLLWATGLRCHELAALTWDDVNLTDAEINLPLCTKTGTRDIPLAPAHVEALQGWRQRCGHGGDGEPLVKLSTRLSRGLSYRVVGVRRFTEGRKTSTGACQAVGVPEYTPQGLRRLAVDALYEAAQQSKVDVGTVAALMGHSPATALRHYRTPSRKSKRAAVLAAGLGTVPDRGEVTTTL